jgi:hypothetical protein
MGTFPFFDFNVKWTFARINSVEIWAFDESGSAERNFTMPYPNPSLSDNIHLARRITDFKPSAFSPAGVFVCISS